MRQRSSTATTITATLLLLGLASGQGASDRVSPDSVAAAMYEVVSGGAGVARDWERLRRLFCEGARMVFYMDEGSAGTELGFDDYVERFGPLIEAQGVFEREVFARTDRFGRIAQRWSTYEARMAPDDPEPLFRGCASIQLIEGDDGWRVLSMVLQHGSEGLPVPGRWLGEGQEPSLPRRILGAWRAAGAEPAERLVLFEPGRCVQRFGESLEHYRCDYREGRVRLEQNGRFQEHSLEMRGDTLLLGDEAGAVELERLDMVPEALALRPLALGEAGQLSADVIARVSAELQRRKEEDQRVRTEDVPSGEWLAIDLANTAFIRKLVERVGWIDATRFGAMASSSAWLLVQHSGDLPLMMAVLPAVEADARAGRVPGDDYALLFDRLQLALGHPQRYGSQLVGAPDGRVLVQALEDRDHVDQLRASLRMQPLADYLQHFRRDDPSLQIGFVDDERW